MKIGSSRFRLSRNGRAAGDLTDERHIAETLRWLASRTSRLLVLGGRHISILIAIDPRPRDQQDREDGNSGPFG